MFLDGKFQVIIVGASLAGSFLAHQLGAKGISVLLLEKESFPRSKVCGEGLSAYGIHLLESGGIPLADCQGSPINGYEIWRRNAWISITSGGVEPGIGRGIQRLDLDDIVYRAASKHRGVSSVLGAVKSIAEKDGGTSVVLSDGRRFNSQLLVLACGARSRLLQAFPTIGRAYRYGMSFHASVDRSGSPLLERVRIVPQKGYQIYITPVSKSLLNISVLATKAVANKLFVRNASGDLLQSISEYLQQPLEMYTAPSATGPIGNARREAAGSRILLVGDAVETFDPIGGMGMTHALHSANIAADFILRACTDTKQVVPLVSEYYMQRRAAAKIYRGFTKLSQITLGVSLPRKFYANSLVRKICQVPHAVAEPSWQATIARSIVNVMGSL